MPDKYKRKPGGYHFNANTELQKEAFDLALVTFKKYQDNRNLIYQQLISIKDEERRQLRIIKSWLRKYPNLPVARDVANELGKLQEALDEEITELQTKVFLEGDLTNEALTIINKAIIALTENEQIVQESLTNDTPAYLDESFIQTLVTDIATQAITRIMMEFPTQSQPDTDQD